MTTKRLTDNERRVLGYLKEFITEHGHGPTLHQVRRRLGCRSTSTVHKHVRRLCEKGWIEKRGRVYETIVVREEKSRTIVLRSEMRADETLVHAAGNETVTVPAGLAGAGRAWALRVRGWRIPGEQIQDGDVLIVEERTQAAPGDLVVGRLDDDATMIAKLPPSGQPATAQQRKDPSAASRAIPIQGIVTGMIRRYATAGN